MIVWYIDNWFWNSVSIKINLIITIFQKFSEPYSKLQNFVANKNTLQLNVILVSSYYSVHQIQYGLKIE